MNIKNKILWVILFLLTFLSCTLYSPHFEMKDNCIVKTNRGWFNYILINTYNPRERYKIKLKNCNGVTKICFDNIPENYIVIKGWKDTLNTSKLVFKEGQIVKILNSGGDRASYSAEFIVRNGNFVKYDIKEIDVR